MACTSSAGLLLLIGQHGKHGGLALYEKRDRALEYPPARGRQGENLCLLDGGVCTAVDQSFCQQFGSRDRV